MTPEEQARIAQLEADLAKAKEQIKNQNSYITKLEAGKGTNPQPTPGANTGLDPITQRYLEKNMIKDTIADAEKIILTQVQPEIYEAVKPDFKEWLDKNLNIKNCTVEFIGDAFSLIYGKCLRNKEHAVNKIGKDNNPQVVTPNSQPANPNPNPQVNVNTFQTPPVITNKDGNPSVPPLNQPAKSKADIFKNFERKLAGGGNNPFSN